MIRKPTLVTYTNAYSGRNDREEISVVLYPFFYLTHSDMNKYILH